MQNHGWIITFMGKFMSKKCFFKSIGLGSENLLLIHFRRPSMIFRESTLKKFTQPLQLECVENNICIGMYYVVVKVEKRQN